MTTSEQQQAPSAIERWSRWCTCSLERLPLPYSLIVVLAGLLMLAEQVLEHYLDDPIFADMDAGHVAGMLVLPLMTIYILIFLKILKRWGIRGLAELRDTVQISDEAYEGHVQRLIHADWRLELALLAVAAVFVIVPFVLVGWELMNSTHGLPDSPALAGFILAMYLLFGWLLLSQVYCTIRHATGLRRLAQQPLDIDVFDPRRLLPFGRLSLLHTLPNIGVLFIPILIFGPPTESGFLMVPFVLLALLVLFIPLWGVHRQMDAEKERVEDQLYAQLSRIRRALLRGDEEEYGGLGALSERAAVLVPLLELVDKSPTWPFTDTAEIARVVIAVLSPLVYFLLNELIAAYIIPLLRGS